MKKLLTLLIVIPTIMTTLSSCSGTGKAEAPVETGWQETLQNLLPLLGHRNWIVIADMAYPLQSGQGIETIFADEPYLDVLAATLEMIDEAPHVFAHVYHDKELDFISEDLIEGIEELRGSIKEICGPEAQSVLHEDLIKRLDEAGRLYNVVIIKTPLTVPYTTTFLELDCNYWGPDSQSRLDELME